MQKGDFLIMKATHYAEGTIMVGGLQICYVWCIKELKKAFRSLWMYLGVQGALNLVCGKGGSDFFSSMVC